MLGNMGCDIGALDTCAVWCYTLRDGAVVDKKRRSRALLVPAACTSPFHAALYGVYETLRGGETSPVDLLRPPKLSLGHLRTLGWANGPCGLPSYTSTHQQPTHPSIHPRPATSPPIPGQPPPWQRQNTSGSWGGVLESSSHRAILGLPSGIYAAWCVFILSQLQKILWGWESTLGKRYRKKPEEPGYYFPVGSGKNIWKKRLCHQIDVSLMTV